jgi:hypothetical protein
VEQELNPHIKAFAIGRGRGLNNKSGRGRSTGGRTQSNGSYPFLHQPWPNSSQVNFCPGTTRLPSSNHFRPPSQFPMTSFGNRQTPYPRNTIDILGATHVENLAIGGKNAITIQPGVNLELIMLITKASNLFIHLSSHLYTMNLHTIRTTQTKISYPLFRYSSL